MRTIYLTFSAIVAMTIMAANATAKQPTIVYPTGIFPTDVQNVQAAIDQGGTVLLKATDSVGHPLAFNFGTPQHLLPLRAVLIQTNVSIIGELVGSNRTTISGGSKPFRVVGGKNSIQGIKFDGPLTVAIQIFVSSGIGVIGNEIENVVPDPLLIGFTQSDGIDVGNGGNPANISGNVVISGNTVGDLTGDFSIAIQVDSVAANVTISNNTFQLGQSPTDVGFVNSSGIACIRCHSVVAISNNMFQGNTVSGDAVVAILASFLVPNGDIVSSNTFLNNDIASLAASLASIFFDTNTLNNLVRGQCVSVLDLGIGNDVSCPNSHSNVASASAAIAARNQMLQRAMQAQSAVHASITNLGSNP